MPVLLWLALLLGYFVGVLGALFLLPAPVVEPLMGRIVIASIVVMLGTATMFVLQRRQSHPPLPQRAAHAPPPQVADPAGPSLDPALAGGEPDDRIDDVVGDPERLRAMTARLLDPSSRAADGSVGPRELRQLLYGGRIGVLVRPVIALPAREPAFVKVTPQLLDHQEEVVPPGAFRRSLARCGLGPVFDRVQVIRALQTADAARDGDLVPLIACSIDVASLASPVLLDGLDEFFRDHVGRGERLILEFDRMPREPAARQAMRRLARHGVRFALERLSPAPLDLERTDELGFRFVRLAAPRFAMLPGAAAGALPSLGAFLTAAERAGLVVVVDQADSEPAPLLSKGRVDAPLPRPPDIEVRDDAA